MKRIKLFIGKGLYPYQLSFLLTVPFRKFFISPVDIANFLDFKEDSSVLEIGCGPGYFTSEVAKRIGDSGFFCAVDIQKEMVEKARDKLKRMNVDNVSFKVCDAVSLPFPENSFDIVFCVAVLGEVLDREKLFSSVWKVLKPGGRFVVVEQSGDPDSLSGEELLSLSEEKFILKEKIKRRFYVAYKFVKHIN
ncbi:class I SAM-dependent methyltransferase [Desulfurobacterium sp.]